MQGATVLRRASFVGAIGWLVRCLVEPMANRLLATAYLTVGTSGEHVDTHV